jgi:hypothetical protein
MVRPTELCECEFVMLAIDVVHDSGLNPVKIANLLGIKGRTSGY